MFVGGYSDDTAFQMLHILGGDIWKRMLQSGVLWSEWIKLSDATPPQEFNLPLAEEIGGSGRYIKTQESIVYVFGWVTGVQLESEIAILPEGFRPKYNVVATTSASSNDAANNSARIRFSTDGRIVAEKADDTNALKNGLSIVGCFLANNS